VRSVRFGNEIAELLFCTFSEDQGSSTSVRQLWEVHTLIIVIENAELIGMGVFRTWYWKENVRTLEHEDDGEFPF